LAELEKIKRKEEKVVLLSQERSTQMKVRRDLKKKAQE